MHETFEFFIGFQHWLIISLDILDIQLHIPKHIKALIYLWVSPKAKSSIVIVYGPAKSWMMPSLIAIPVCPINGKSQVIKGKGVQTMQKGNLACSASILAYSIFIFISTC